MPYGTLRLVSHPLASDVSVMEVDQALVIAASQQATGASAHEIHQLLCVYYLACEVGQKQHAANAEAKLRRFLSKRAKQYFLAAV